MSQSNIPKSTPIHFEVHIWMYRNVKCLLYCLKAGMSCIVDFLINLGQGFNAALSSICMSSNKTACAVAQRPEAFTTSHKILTDIIGCILNWLTCWVLSELCGRHFPPFISARQPILNTSYIDSFIYWMFIFVGTSIYSSMDQNLMIFFYITLKCYSA